jgi:plasmid maintenance system antidote protein VapI
MTSTRVAPLVGLSIVVMASIAVHGQFWDKVTNPQVPTTIAHPPNLGIQVNRVAFGSAQGVAAEDFVDALTARFVQANVEVIERSRVNALMREQNFGQSGVVDRQTAVQMGKVLGATVMIFVNLQRHAYEKKSLYTDWKDSKERVHRTYISRTQAFVRGSIRSVDLATSRIFAAQVFEANPIVENKIDDRCCAEYPEEFAVVDSAMADVVRQAERMYLPWTEVVQLYYFDDKDCGLNNAFNRHKAGDIAGALDLSLVNLEQCKALAKPNQKALAHANHNVGMGYFSLGQHGKALAYLEESQRLRPGDIAAEAVAACRRAADLARDMQRVEERATYASVAADQKIQATAAAAAAQTLTNADIMALVKAKLPAVVILSKIKTSPCKFDTSTRALIQLSEAGVPSDVITAMMDCGKK